MCVCLNLHMHVYMYKLCVCVCVCVRMYVRMYSCPVCQQERDALDSHLLKKELVKLIEVFNTRDDLPLAEGESPPLLHHTGAH